MTGANKVIKTSLLSGTSTMILSTDSNGNTAAFIFPSNASNPSPTVPTGATTVFASYNPSGFTPANGTLTGVTFQPGPIAAIASSIQSFRLVSFSIRITPITSVNSSGGNIQIALFDEYGITSSSGLPVIPQAAVSVNPFYQSGNLLSTYRSVLPPIGVVDLQNVSQLLNNVATDTSFFYVLITGAVANQPVVKIDYSYTYELVPTCTQASLTFADWPEVGPATTELLNAIFITCPQAQMAGLDYALKVAESFQGSDDESYSGLLKLAHEILSTVQSKTFPIFSSSTGQANTSEISFLKD